jgi:hypothetical protein
LIPNKAPTEMNHSTVNNVIDGDGTDRCDSYIHHDNRISNGTSTSSYAARETTYQSQTPNDGTMNYYSKDFDSNNNNKYDDDNQNDYDDEDDRKPPAKPTLNDSMQTIVDVDHQANNPLEVVVDDDAADDDDDDDDENNQNDDEDEDEDDENSNASSSKPETPIKAEDGRPLSEYEILRLERMKRNREYLSQLGLETNKDHDKNHPLKKQKPVRPKKEVVVIRRSSISRRTKMQPIRYVEPKSIRELLETANFGMGPKSSNNKDETKNGISSTTETTNLVPGPTIASSPSSSLPTDAAPSTTHHDYSTKALCNKLDIPYERKNRMEIFIYKEFRRIRSYQRTILQKVERLHRNVEKELKYWSNQNDIYIRKQQKKQQQQQLLIMQRNYAMMMQKQNQNKMNKKEIVQQMDRKMPHIIQAINKYDLAISVRSSSVHMYIHIYPTTFFTFYSF